MVALDPSAARSRCSSGPGSRSATWPGGTPICAQGQVDHDLDLRAPARPRGWVRGRAPSMATGTGGLRVRGDASADPAKRQNRDPHVWTPIWVSMALMWGLLDWLTTVLFADIERLTNSKRHSWACWLATSARARGQPHARALRLRGRVRPQRLGMVRDLASLAGPSRPGTVAADEHPRGRPPPRRASSDRRHLPVPAHPPAGAPGHQPNHGSGLERRAPRCRAATRRRRREQVVAHQPPGRTTGASAPRSRSAS
jgi:hypothetical protein